MHEKQSAFPITRTEPPAARSASKDWFDPRPEVFQLREQTPAQVARGLERVTPGGPCREFKSAYIQPVQEFSGSNPEAMAVEATRLIIPVPYRAFASVIPPEAWGRNLAGYLGGEVAVLEKDNQSRATRQIERMVLAAPFKQLDMTKSEVLVYEEDRAAVYWRVFHSDNQTTLADTGWVEFAQAGPEATRVTFQSAHKLYLPNFLVRLTLADTFMQHLRQYQSRVFKP